CFNISCANHFAGAINYDVNREIPFVRNCDMTIPWIAGTGDMDDIGNQIPGWDRTEGCNQMNLTHASCVMIKNNECPLHQVRVGYDSNSTNTTCYYISNVTAYGGTNGPSFFDRLDGNYELGSKYLNQSIYYFNNSWIGIETLVDPYELNSFSVQVKMNATWVDYLYWQNVQGCKVSGMCGAGSYNFRLDNVHARMFNLDTDCVNVTECPTGDEACVNCFDEDNDTLWDWEDDNCDAFFNDCGQVHSCDPMDTDHCSTCDVPMPPEANSSQTCSYYGFNATEWHFYRITPAQSGKLRVSFSGTSGAPSDQKTDIIFYNYSIDGNTCSNRTVKYNIEPSSTFDYCVTAGQIYVLGLDVDSTACGYNGTYELQTQVTAGDPLCTTTTTSTTTTTNPAPTTTSSSTTSSTSTTSTSTTTTQPSCGFFDNMEFGVGSWTHGGAQDEWQLGSPSWGSAYSGSNVWATDLVGDYQDNASEWLKTRSISLVTATNPRLRFWEKRQVENNYDYCYVEVSTDNLNWDTIQTYTGNRNSWTERSLSLNSYTGVNVWIRFRLESDGDITRYGWYLDNVNVTCS
ncbi:MAG: hypothetical protein NTU61_02545, partial [Candidatus Altiarchaeota archaeon]|nr:hypothetical protein [Candidatus Altiarchaeota archaeon]